MPEAFEAFGVCDVTLLKKALLHGQHIVPRVLSTDVHLHVAMSSGISIEAVDRRYEGLLPALGFGVNGGPFRIVSDGMTAT